MPIQVPVLDNRRFDDLVAEARQRISSHTPEWTRMSPGDPGAAIVDVLAWLTETILYRANLIPERQRLAFLKLLHIPLRPALAARGVVCLDATGKSALLPPLVQRGTVLQAGAVSLSTDGEIQPTPLALSIVGKRAVTRQELDAAGITRQQLVEQYGTSITPFRPYAFAAGEPVRLDSTLDHSVYLALSVLGTNAEPSAISVRASVAGITLSVALAPNTDPPAALAATVYFYWRRGILGTIVSGTATLLVFKLGFGW